MKELEKRYNAKEIEERIYKNWEEKGFFKPETQPQKSAGRPYVIVIPPPNVTGILHMGHALNNTIQDVMIRFNRMKGIETLWVPGVDHAGIATQNVVEKKLAKEGKRRWDLGREKFLEEVWKWKKESGDTITRQLRRLGASCDWSREAFTMNENLSKAVREVFVTLHDKGLIYQGNRIINWCPRCQTALSDEEAEHKDTEGGLYHLKYSVVGKKAPFEKMGEDHIVVATTRPETMLGDTAVAVNPEDPRYKHLIGKKLLLPLVNREIPVIADEFVDPKFGTGMVKVTPAHDPNDFEMGQRHNLPQINVMQPNGKMNEFAGDYNGMDRFEARKKVIEDLEAQGLFLKKEKHMHAVGQCYRCQTVVEPYLSKQWFVKMKPLADKALKEHKAGKTVFTPDRWTKVYTNWLEGIRDWCISRQIWWGHQIPAWYCDACASKNQEPRSKDQDLVPGSCSLVQEPIVSRETPKNCPKCGSDKLRQDPDVLDTWFSSWLWPFSTLGWPDKNHPDLKKFYPGSDLITAPEIIFFWVARMIMAGCEFLGEVPFNRIYLHGTVRDDQGRKMSKSLGNSIDPLEVIEEMGADALRWSLVMLSAQDVYLSREKFEVGRNFTNKLWNASRFVLMGLEGYTEGTAELKIDPKTLPAAHRWILSTLEKKTKLIEKELAQFGLSQASTELYHFVWNDFCDWFIELAKPYLQDEKTKKETQAVLFYVLEKILRLLHPFMPFTTEEIWQRFRDLAQDKDQWPETIMHANWSGNAMGSMSDETAEKEIDLLQRAVTGFRDLQVLQGQSLKTMACATVVHNPQVQVSFERQLPQIVKLAKVQSISFVDAKDMDMYSMRAYPDFSVLVPKASDSQKETEMLEKKIAELKPWIESMEKKLSNENFVARAPKQVIDGEKAKLEDAKKLLVSCEEQLAKLK
ncbi:MAG TPA: valine--tRNA ligase [Candidatus Omnitrophota bacterium]|nr:valine--tRNA ligase [Candidatus Omnitrophota bacterium]